MTKLSVQRVNQQEAAILAALVSVHQTKLMFELGEFDKSNLYMKFGG